MSVVNIRRDVTDKYYRYKMPKLVAKVEGKGNGIKTVLVNMADVAKALSRPASYPTKYFGGELGTQSKIDEKNDRFIINGAHEAEKLQNILDGFITKFVLCDSCKNPETEFIFSKDDSIVKDCKACGAHSPVDARHKLVTFILKNKPEYHKKKDKYRKNEQISNVGEDKDAAAVVDDQLVKEMEALPTAEEVGVDETWADDVSPEAIEARMKELAVNTKLTGEDDLQDPMEVFADYLAAESTLSNEQIIEKATELEIRDDKVCVVLAQVVFNQDILKENQVEKKAELFKHFMKNEKSQKGLLGGIERLVSLNHPELLDRVALVFKDLYFADLIEEQTFLDWNEKITKKYVEKKYGKLLREKAEPFINWLATAEEESD